MKTSSNTDVNKIFFKNHFFFFAVVISLPDFQHARLNCRPVSVFKWQQRKHYTPLRPPPRLLNHSEQVNYREAARTSAMETAGV